MGETALRVSRRRLEPFPKVRTCWVSRRSLGRCWSAGGSAAGRGAIMGSWAWAVVMMCAGGSREPSAGAMECDIVDNIMRTDVAGVVGGAGVASVAEAGGGVSGGRRR